MLLEHRGEIVTRDELRQRLWPADTFVDFDDGLNTAVKKIRDLLGDSAERPRYIETIPRRGYRFCADVEPVQKLSGPAQTIPRAGVIPHWRIAVGVIFAAVLLAAWSYRTRLSSGTTPVRAIVVLPLKNLSGDPSQDYFAAGLTYALTTELARAVGSSVRVTSHSSAEKYNNKSLQQIAGELDVDAVVEGSVVRSGNRAHITAQLIHARADKHLWAATYDRDLHDLLTVQTEIAATITRQIRATLSPRTEVRLAAPVAVDPEAYDLYQRGRSRAFSNNSQELALAIADLNKSIALEPNFAVAYALLGRAYITQEFFAQPDEQTLDAMALDKVNRALNLDPDLADAHLARGIIYWTHRNGFPHERAIQEIKHAVELDPSLAEGHHEMAKVFMHIGLLERAETELRTALQVEPTNTGMRYRIAVNQLLEGKAEEAIVGLEGTRVFTPDLWTYQMSFALFQLGRKKEAVDLIREYLRDNPLDQGGVGNAMQALLYADAGEALMAERSIHTAIQKGTSYGHFHHAAYTIGAAYALMQRPAEAVRWLRAAADDGFPCYPLYERDHSLEKLRQDPQFQKFMGDLKDRWQHYKTIF
jgi:TolB-like protein